MFSFNHNKFDFWPIYETVKEFYPIGIPKNEPNDMYRQYPGLKKLEALLVENIHHDGSFSSCWKSIERFLREQTGKEVVGTTYGQAPSFSSRLILEKKVFEGLTRYQELFYSVSLLGPYYTVLGRDMTEIVLDGKTVPIFQQAEAYHFYSTTILTTSPVNEYADLFEQICNRIEEQFPGYRLVPYWINRQTIPGLEVPYSDEKREAIFHALFNDQVDLATTSIGDDYYGSEAWIKEGYDPETAGGWVIYPPSGPIGSL